MRVVSGKARGITLLTVPGDTTRPIMDRVKTALFDVLRPTLADTRWLDMFGGSGAVGIEALSQGAAHCVFVDVEPKAIQTIRKNLESTKLADKAEVRQTDAFLYLRKTEKQFDVIYIAPPQYKSLWIEALHTVAERPDLLAPGGSIIAQIDPSEYEPVELADFNEASSRKYGNTQLLFFERK
jgi:16S rRNA (guanine966-N2)-methyltransferase